jgi:hypothetical protein
VSFVVLLADLVYLRQRAVAAQRQQRLVRRREAWVAREQAAVRREHSRRAAERAATARRVVQERDAARRGVSPGYVERYRATPS